MSEFDPLAKQRSNSDDSETRLLDAAVTERPRSGSLGGEGTAMLPLSISASSIDQMSQQHTKPPDRPMRSVSLDQKVSQSKGIGVFLC